MSLSKLSLSSKALSNPQNSKLCLNAFKSLLLKNNISSSSYKNRNYTSGLNIRHKNNQSIYNNDFRNILNKTNSQSNTSKTNITSFSNSLLNSNTPISIRTSALPPYIRTFTTAREKVLGNADSLPNDENIQEMAYKELIEMGDYETIIKRFESLAFSSNEECVRYYFKALVYSGKINKANLGLAKLPPPTKKMSKAAMEALASEEAMKGFFLRFNHFPDVNEKIHQKPVVPIFTINNSGKTNLSWFDRVVSLLWLPVLLFLLYSLSSDPTTKETNATGKNQYFAKEYDSTTSTPTSFDDVKGIQEVKEELAEIVDYLLHPNKYNSIGAKLPKGVLLSGEPGTGKTLLARAIAGEAGVSFLYTTGSSFDEKYVGVGSRRIRELFAAAREKQPCIIFIDEIDAVGKSRNNTQYNDTLLQLLAEMDGFEGNSQIMIIGATNAPNSLDPALLRPGRFDRHIAVPIPDIKGRAEIIDHYLTKIKHSIEVKADTIARATPGFTGADLSNLINTAAIKAVQNGKETVSLQQIDDARDDILMGRARLNGVMSEEARRNTAYHEAGHALVAAMTDAADPIHKATIVQRGQALGMVSQLPEMDHVQFTRKQMMARLAICLAGRAAEEIFFGDDGVTSGASSDFQQASSLAFSMVTKWGMSDKVGFTYHKDKMSPEVQKLVEDEVKDLLDKQYQYSKELIIKNKDNMERLVGQLIEKETLTGDEILKILNVKSKISLPQIQNNNNNNISVPSSPSGTSLLPIPVPSSSNPIAISL
ncbi:hypothetical protein RB653_003564 [Dictyostelium firmibasis]|uniref:AAA+ ATPase domain-containing protein n=1 Tax=Dictyostelium firmibasis TaxID=79012 RepID=A0AAN7U891_9MYCE